MVCSSVNLDSGVENIALEGDFIKHNLIKIHLDEIVKYFSLDSSKNTLSLLILSKLKIALFNTKHTFREM